MARFTFGAGNARKLLRVPLYALGAFASRVVPRTPRLWVFGSGIGLGEGALPLYRAARERLPEGTRLVWLASTEAELAEARALGLDAERKAGWRGFRLTLRAKVLVVTHGFGDVNRFGTRGGFVVQLWHGIPLKRLHLDSPATLRISGVPDHRLVRGLLSWAYRRAGRGIREVRDRERPQEASRSLSRNSKDRLERSRSRVRRAQVRGHRARRVVRD